MVWYDQQSTILSAAQSLLDAAVEPHLVSPPRTTDTRGIPPTAAEANPNENDLVIVPLSDGTKEYWRVDANGNYGAAPDYTDAGAQLNPPRLVPGDDTILDGENIVANNGSIETILTIAAGVSYFYAGRDIESTAKVTIVPPTGITVSGDATGGVINEAVGQLLFVLEGTDYKVSTPAVGNMTGGAAGSTGITQTELDASHDVTEISDLAARPSSPEIGDIVRQLDDQSTWKFTEDGWEAIYLVPGIDTVLAVAQSLTANRTIAGGGNDLTFNGINDLILSIANTFSLARIGIGSLTFNGAGISAQLENLRAFSIRVKDNAANGGAVREMIRATMSGSGVGLIRLFSKNGNYELGDGAGDSLPETASVNGGAENIDDLDYLMINRDNGQIRRTEGLTVREQDENGNVLNTYAQIMVVKDSATGAISIQVTGSNGQNLTLN